MDGLKLLADAEDAGLSVAAEGDRLVVRGPRKAESLALKLIARKSEILPLLTGHLPADWHMIWDERAAIMEYDGGLPREQAEFLALRGVLQQMNEERGTGEN
jgi:hypothetical protein